MCTQLPVTIFKVLNSLFHVYILLHNIAYFFGVHGQFMFDILKPETIIKMTLKQQSKDYALTLYYSNQPKLTPVTGF